MGLCSHLAHLWAFSDSAPRSQAPPPPPHGASGRQLVGGSSWRLKPRGRPPPGGSAFPLHAPFWMSPAEWCRTRATMCYGHVPAEEHPPTPPHTTHTTGSVTGALLAGAGVHKGMLCLGAELAAHCWA